MRINYYSDTDTLYIELNEAPGTNTRTCAKDMVVDLDENDGPIGIEIENASKKVDLSHLKTKGLSSMRIDYDPVFSAGDLLRDIAHTPLEAPGNTVFLVDLAGNGESARIFSEQLSKQTEFAIADFR